MFSSINNNGNIDPISYLDGLTVLHRPLSSDTLSNSKQEDHLLSFFNLPSPFFHLYEDDSPLILDHDLDHHAHHPPPQPQVSSEDTVAVANNAFINKVDLNNNNANGTLEDGGKTKKTNSTAHMVQRKRTSKKDRHSKIYTARGPRDRRMRLSLEVARKFFDLQDMLGFDKASKTVEWLLLHSKSAIKELSRTLGKMNISCTEGVRSTSSPPSECEMVSGIDEVAGNGDNSANVSQGKPSTRNKEKKTRQPRRNSFHMLARESRKKARARARERTEEKLWMRRLEGSKPCGEAISTGINRRSSPLETREETCIQGNNSMKSSPDLHAEIEEPRSLERKILGITGQVVDDSLAIMRKWSPTFSFNSMPTTGVVQEREFRGSHLFSKAWEAYNNPFQS